MNNSSWVVEHRCPQCGAPVLMEEADRILLCAYCRVRLFLSYRDCARYFLAPRGASPDECLFVPYWRYRGILFSCEENEIRQRVRDVTLLAIRSSLFPPSLGMRPQALKLRPVTSATPGRFLQAHVPLKEALSGRSDAAGPPPGIPQASPGRYEELIGETWSLIFSPVLIRGGTLHDAIDDRPLAAAPEDMGSSFPATPSGEDSFSFLPTLCPRCGWDLEGEKDTLVLLCRNCSAAWEASSEGLRKRGIAVGQESGGPEIHLPFWKVRARASEPRLESFADLVVLANLPRRIEEAWKERGFSFWIPAFKAQPHLFLRLARLFTLSQPSIQLREAVPGPTPYPVTLPVDEAAQSLRITIASLAVPRKSVFPRLPHIQVEIEDNLLCYLPFRQRGSEFIQEAMQIGIDSNALKLGRLI